MPIMITTPAGEIHFTAHARLRALQRSVSWERFRALASLMAQFEGCGKPWKASWGGVGGVFKRDQLGRLIVVTCFCD